MWGAQRIICGTLAYLLGVKPSAHAELSNCLGQKQMFRTASSLVEQPMPPNAAASFYVGNSTCEALEQVSQTHTTGAACLPCCTTVHRYRHCVVPDGQSGSCNSACSQALCCWSFNCPAVDAPLPSVRSARGREEFLQTPAFVIAAHYTRGDTLRSQTHAKELRDKLKQTARFQVRAQGSLNGLEG